MSKNVQSVVSLCMLSVVYDPRLDPSVSHPCRVAFLAEHESGERFESAAIMDCTPLQPTGGVQVKLPATPAWVDRQAVLACIASYRDSINGKLFPMPTANGQIVSGNIRYPIQFEERRRFGFTVEDGVWTQHGPSTVEP